MECCFSYRIHFVTFSKVSFRVKSKTITNPCACLSESHLASKRYLLKVAPWQTVVFVLPCSVILSRIVSLNTAYNLEADVAITDEKLLEIL